MCGDTQKLYIALQLSSCVDLGTARAEQRRSSVNVVHPIGKYSEPLSAPGTGLGSGDEVPALQKLMFWWERDKQ